MVGPWQVPVADVAVTLMDFEGYAGEAMAMGERTPLALIDAPASGRMAVGEAITNLAAAGIAPTRRRQALGQLDGAGRASGRGRRAVRHRARCRDRHLRRASALDSGRQGLDVDAHDVERQRRGQGRDGAGVADRLGVCAGAGCAPDADAVVASRPRRYGAAAHRSRRGPATPGRLGARAGLRAARQRCARPRRSAAARRVLRARCRGCMRDGTLLAYHDIARTAAYS